MQTRGILIWEPLNSVEKQIENHFSTNYRWESANSRSSFHDVLADKILINKNWPYRT